MNAQRSSYRNRTVLGLIPARGGSKSVPGKNKKLLGGLPLIAHTILAATGSKYLSSAVVSTDDEEIAGIAAEYGARVPFLRPAQLSSDSTAALPVVQHALQFLAAEGESFDYVAILQPTSPLRTSDDIDQCIIKIVDTGADSVMSMVELIDFSVKKLKRIENDLILPLIEAEGTASAPRQAAPRVYKRNCAMYLTRADLVLQGHLFGEISRPYLMPAARSVDINTLSDFELAEFFLARAGERKYE